MMRRASASMLIPIVTLMMAGCASGPSKDQQAAAAMPSGPSYTAGNGQNPVGAIPNAVLHDAQRNRDVEMTIDYPTRGAEANPVVILSHGYGRSKNDYVPLSEFWTTHGYVCIKPNHADAGAATGKDPKDLDAGWRAQTEADWRNRARDLSFIADSLTALEDKYPELRGKMDHARIVVAGHGYGALAALEVGGMRTSSSSSGANANVKAIVAMSPPALADLPGVNASAWSDVKLPVLFLVPGRDRAPDATGPNPRRDAFANSPAGDKYYVELAGASDRTFVGRWDLTDDDLRRRSTAPVPPPIYPADPRDPRANDPFYGQQPVQEMPRGNGPAYGRERNVFNTVKSSTLAFLDAYTKNETKGKDYLRGELLRSTAGGAVETK